MKTIIYSLITAFIVWTINQVASLSVLLSILIFIASISILVNIKFLINWIQAEKEKDKLNDTINQTKSENQELLKEIKNLKNNIDKLYKNQTALRNNIVDKNESIDGISRRANNLGNVINTLIAQDNTDKLAQYVSYLLQIGEHTNDK